MDWPALLRAIKAHKLTQQQIADWCCAAGVDVTQSAISDLESGKTRSPRYELGHALEALRKHVDAEAIRAAPTNAEAA